MFKLCLSGDTLVYSTFVGGNKFESGETIIIGANNEVFVAGHTLSTNFPEADDHYESPNIGSFDCFVFKLSSTGSDLLFTARIGGSDIDKAYSMTLDIEDEDNPGLFVVGETRSVDFPTVDHPHDDSHNGGFDCFLFKLALDGSSLIYSTYIGGSTEDIAYSVDLLAGGSVYLTGSTKSGDFPTKSNSLSHSGAIDCFIAYANTNGGMAAVLVGGNDHDIGYSVKTFGAYAYVTGLTYSNDFYLRNAEDISYSSEECFLVSVDTLFHADAYLYSSYLGGNGWDVGYSIDIDSEGNLYITGLTTSDDFPSSINPYNDFLDCFVYKIKSLITTTTYTIEIPPLVTIGILVISLIISYVSVISNKRKRKR